MRRILELPSLAVHCARELATSAGARSDGEIEALIRGHADTIYQPVGTCRLVYGPLDVVDVHCDGHLVQRRPEDIRNQPSTTCYVYRQLEGTAWFEQRGRHLVTHAGDIVIADPNVAFSTGAEGTFDFRLWRLQRSRIEPMLALRSGDLPMIKLERRSAEGALINSWLDGLLRNYGGMQSRSLDIAVGTLCALVADAVGLAPEMRDRGRDSRRAPDLPA